MAAVPARGSARGPLRFPANIPFVEDVGLELWAAADGRSEVRVTLDARHANNLAMAHGGVLMTLLDVAMAQAARTRHQAGEPLGPAVATVEMKTTFLQPARGTHLVARGEVLHRTRSMAFCAASAFDPEGRLCAQATGTFHYVRPPAGSEAGGAAPTAPETTA